MGNVQFNLSEGMTKKQVLKEAKRCGLDKNVRKQIKEFFVWDNDKQISNANELEVLTGIFNGTNNVQMPKENTIKNELGSVSVYTNKKGKEERRDILFDRDNDGYAESRTLQETITEKDGYQETYAYADYNTDGEPDEVYRIKGGTEEVIKKHNEFEPHGNFSFGAGHSSMATGESEDTIRTNGVLFDFDIEKEHFDCNCEVLFGKSVQLHMNSGYNIPLKTLNNGITQLGVEPYVGLSYGEKNIPDEYENKEHKIHHTYFGAGTMVTLRQSNPEKRFVYKLGAGVEGGLHSANDYNTVGVNERGFATNIESTTNEFNFEPVVKGRVYDKKTGIGGTVSFKFHEISAGLSFNLAKIFGY